MQAQYHSSPKVCSNSHHSAKRQLLGNPAANIAPAWKLNAQAKEKQKLQEESKILLSRLPADVGDTEVEVSTSISGCWGGNMGWAYTHLVKLVFRNFLRRQLDP